MGYKAGDLPLTESLSARLLRLPFYYELSYENQQEIVNLIYKFFGMTFSHNIFFYRIMC